jgi:predicted metal-dependent phosphoesterase TrpH
MIDLHVHTNMSDGSLSPAEVVRRSAENGLQAIAITDHDTVAGIAEARAEGLRAGVEVISGVEMSVQWDPGIVHILGFFIRPDDSELLESLAYLGTLPRPGRNLTEAFSYTQ